MPESVVERFNQGDPLWTWQHHLTDLVRRPNGHQDSPIFASWLRTQSGPCSSSYAVPIIRNWTQSESAILSKQETSSFSHLPPIFLQQRESNSCSLRSSQRGGSQSVGWPRKAVPWGAFLFVSVSARWTVEVPRSKPDRPTRKEPTGKLSSQDHYLSWKMNSSVAWRSQFPPYYHSQSAVAWLIHFLTLILRSGSPQRPSYCLDMLRLGLLLLFRRTWYLIPF